MGEFADYALDDIDDYIEGYDIGYDFEYAQAMHFGDHKSGGEGASTSKTCRYCGMKGLHWKKLPEGWRLYTSDDVIHVCDKYQHKEPEQ